MYLLCRYILSKMKGVWLYPLFNYLDPDLSSLHSEINQDPSLPSWASRSSSSLKLQNEDDPIDKPIIPSAKTFEQLLEEKLEQDNIERKEPDSKDPKPFLRRGSGLVRYGGVGGPKSLTPKLKRSQSHRGSKNSLNLKIDSRYWITSLTFTEKLYL